MMISQKFFLSVYCEEQLKKFVKSECEESYSSDLTEMFCACFKKCLQKLQINLEAKRMDGFSWKNNSIISVFTLFVAAEVLFTVNGLL